MAVAFQLVFQDFPPSPAVESRIKDEVSRFDRYSDWITNCRVVICEPHRSQHKGRLFEAHIYLPLVDGGEIVVNKSENQNHAHEDVYVAIRDSFQAALRQLRVHIRKKRRRGVRGDQTEALQPV
ncbi:MAG: HPF/RaiA family ribosome-associated protein [Sphingomonadales bacterium]